FVIIWLQFVTAATGMAACVAIFRGLAGHRLTTIGNFYRDCTRASVRVLLPLAVLVAVLLAWQGVPVTYGGAVPAPTVERNGLSSLWAGTTTVTSNGSVNAMHDAVTPPGGRVALAGMRLNNIFGGVGVGFINMVLYLIVTVFVAGMMVGRTPEVLGKKVEARE